MVFSYAGQNNRNRPGPRQNQNPPVAPPPLLVSQRQKPIQNPNNIQTYLMGDPIYQQQLSALFRERQLTSAENDKSRGYITEDFQTALDRMRHQRGLDLQNQASDFASRGLADSGLYLTARNRYNYDFQNQLEDLTRDRSRNLFELADALAQSNSLYRTNLAAARVEAL